MSEDCKYNTQCKFLLLERSLFFTIPAGIVSYSKFLPDFRSPELAEILTGCQDASWDACKMVHPKLSNESHIDSIPQDSFNQELQDSRLKLQYPV